METIEYPVRKRLNLARTQVPVRVVLGAKYNVRMGNTLGGLGSDQLP